MDSNQRVATLEETMEHMVPPPKRRIGENSVIIKHKPVTEMTETQLTKFNTDLEDEIRDK
jgi:hypothetical protein